MFMSIKVTKVYLRIPQSIFGNNKKHFILLNVIFTSGLQTNRIQATQTQHLSAYKFCMKFNTQYIFHFNETHKITENIDPTNNFELK